MLSLPNDGRYPTLELTPQQRRQKTLEALTAQLEVLSRSNPVLMIFEDVHWIDPTSLEALGRTVDRLRTLGVLLIVTFPTGVRAALDWATLCHRLSLNRLGEREIAAMIDASPATSRCREHPARHHRAHRWHSAVRRGNDEGGAGGGERRRRAKNRRCRSILGSGGASNPARLTDGAARPARSCKRIAQIGAAIGREFSHGQLAAVVRKPEAELQSALDRLVAAGLLFRQGTPPMQVICSSMH